MAGERDKYDDFLDGTTSSTATNISSAVETPKASVAPMVPTDRKSIYEQVANEQSFGENFLAGAGGAVEGWRLRLQQLLGRTPTDAEIQEYQTAVSALRGTGGGLVGEIFSNFMPGLGITRVASTIPAVASALTRGGAAGFGTNVGLGTLTGAAEGAMIPTQSTESSAENIAKTALYGGGGAGAVGAVGELGRPIVKAVSPFFGKNQAQLAGGGMLNSAVGEQAPGITQALHSNTPIISSPNAAQAAVSAASPEFSAMQKLVDRLNPYPGSRLATAQQEGRKNLIGTFAKDEAALTAAENARRANAIANYGAALNQRVKADADLGAVLRDPYVKDTFGEVSKLVSASSVSGKPVPFAEQLQMIKKELDGKLADTSLSDNQRNAILDVQGRLTAWMRNKLPGYSKAMDKYAEESKDIFQMKGGQAIQSKLAKPVGDGESPASLANAIRQETSLVKSAGGFKGKSLEDQFTPTNYAKIEKVLGELDVDANLANLARQGAQSTAVQSAVGSAIHLPNLMNSAIAITNGVLKRVMGAGELKTLKELSEIMQDPKLTADIMEKASAKEKNAIRFLMRMQQTGGTASAAFAETQQ